MESTSRGARERLYRHEVDSDSRWYIEDLPGPSNALSVSSNSLDNREDSDVRPEMSTNIKTASNKQINCKLCGTSFSRYSNLNRHLRIKHPSKPTPTTKQSMPSKREPPKAVDAKPSASSLDHKSAKKFCCPICSDTFSKQFNLNRHLYRTHKQEPADEATRKTVICFLCESFSCGRILQLAEHIVRDHQIPIIRINHQFYGEDKFEKLIEDLRTRFSASFKRRFAQNSHQDSADDRYALKCKFSTKVEDPSGRVRRSPCTFHLNILKFGSLYKAIGCGTHFGHQVDDDNIEEILRLFDCNSDPNNPTNTPDFRDSPLDSDEELKVLDVLLANNFNDTNDNIDDLSTMAPTNQNEFLLNQIDLLIRQSAENGHPPTSSSKRRRATPSNRPKTAAEAPTRINREELCGDDNSINGVVDSFSGSSGTQMSTMGVGNYIQKLMKLEEISPDVYRTNYLSDPSGRKGNAYGGLLFAQSLRAAQLTLDGTRFSPHSMHTYFILNVDSTGIADYQIQRIRDGKSYSTRYVNAVQNGKIAMSSQISFCAKEDSSIEHQFKMPDIPGPENFHNNVNFCRDYLDRYERGEVELTPNTIRSMNHVISTGDQNLFEVRSCEPMRYYGLERTETIQPFHFWTKTRAELGDDPDEHRFLIAFMTDMTMASAANRLHSGRGYTPSMVLSLDHAVRWHNECRADEWLLYENISPWAKYGRALTEGRLWKRDGTLVLSVSQESLSRTRGEKSSL